MHNAEIYRCCEAEIASHSRDFICSRHKPNGNLYIGVKPLAVACSSCWKVGKEFYYFCCSCYECSSGKSKFSDSPTNSVPVVVEVIELLLSGEETSREAWVERVASPCSTLGPMSIFWREGESKFYEFISKLFLEDGVFLKTCLSFVSISILKMKSALIYAFKLIVIRMLLSASRKVCRLTSNHNRANHNRTQTFSLQT